MRDALERLLISPVALTNHVRGVHICGGAVLIGDCADVDAFAEQCSAAIAKLVFHSLRYGRTRIAMTLWSSVSGVAPRNSSMFWKMSLGKSPADRLQLARRIASTRSRPYSST